MPKIEEAAVALTVANKSLPLLRKCERELELNLERLRNRISELERRRQLALDALEGK